jgi:hypothetical protein
MRSHIRGGEDEGKGPSSTSHHLRPGPRRREQTFPPPLSCSTPRDVTTTPGRERDEMPASVDGLISQSINRQRFGQFHDQHASRNHHPNPPVIATLSAPADAINTRPVGRSPSASPPLPGGQATRHAGVIRRERQGAPAIIGAAPPPSTRVRRSAAQIITSPARAPFHSRTRRGRRLY